jgi:hypothetical protein
MPSERGVLLRRAAVTAVLAGGLGAGAATVAIAATHGSAPSTSAATTASTPSKSPATAPSPRPTGKPAHHCPNMGSQAHGNPSTSGFHGSPGQPNG